MSGQEIIFAFASRIVATIANGIKNAINIVDSIIDEIIIS